MADKRLIVALDVSSLEQVKVLVDRLGDSVQYYKVGMELYYSAGSEVISYLRGAGKDVFLDLKLHDIPNTVAKSATALTQLGVTMLNVHASGGPAMMQAASKAVAETAKKVGKEKPKLIAVTILTSISEQEWSALDYGKKTSEQVIHLARLAQQAGMDGVVASPMEAEAIRRACGPDFIIVTPGIRPQGTSLDDQSRIATPADALQAGANYLVVGRPITAVENPRLAAMEVLQQMEGLK